MNHGKFRGKYRNESARNPSWDYAGTGRYFITICTHRRAPYFGEIQNGVMQLSDMGMIINREWKQTAKIRPNVILDEYIVMPDHFHAIITIQSIDGVGTPRRGAPTARNCWQPNSLGSIINQFKSICTKRIWKSGHPHFRWQPRFHDRIIRDDAEFDRIRRYIIDNPKNWNKKRHAVNPLVSAENSD